MVRHGPEKKPLAMSISQIVVRRRIEREFTPVHEHPAIEER